MNENVPVVLYQLSREDLKVDVVAKYNQEGALVVEGCDRGDSVKAAWDDWDYEYSITISANDLSVLALVFDVKTEDRQGLLTALATRFHGPLAFSSFQAFLKEKGIPYAFFSWA